nr:MAG TPA: hypothetical protein [Caudoviricetes sp.]
MLTLTHNKCKVIPITHIRLSAGELQMHNLFRRTCVRERFSLACASPFPP